MWLMSIWIYECGNTKKDKETSRRLNRKGKLLFLKEYILNQHKRL